MRPRATELEQTRRARAQLNRYRQLSLAGHRDGGRGPRLQPYRAPPDLVALISRVR